MEGALVARERGIGAAHARGAAADRDALGVVVDGGGALRGGGVYQARQVPTPKGGLADRSLSGPAALAGIGVEIVRFRGVVLDVEVALAAMLNRDGVLLTTSSGIGVAFD